MSNSEIHYRLLFTPFALSLEKMETKLKCPSCFKLLEQPIMLPCNHVFCSLCITGLNNHSMCPLCNTPFLHADLRPDVHIKTFVNIYKKMNSAVSSTFLNQISQDILTSGSDYPEVKTEVVLNMAKEHQFTPQLDKSSSGNTDTLKPRKEERNRLPTQERKNMSSVGGEAFVDQGAQHNTPSSGHIKDSDNTAQGSEHRTRKSAIRVSCREDLQVENEHINRHDNRGLKRQKMNDEFDVGCKGSTITKDFLPNCDSEHKKESFPEIQPSHASSLLGETMLADCMFCHSFRTTEGSGKMQHYLNGKLVETDQATQSNNVLHVHQKCVDWAPQIYFKGEAIVNLEAELSRASRIKCCSCGKKGAALGCYVKSCRRSFHVPCAYEILDCRWDCENYLVLCPAHSSHKLPCDKPKSKSVNKINHSSNWLILDVYQSTIARDLSSPQGDLTTLKTQNHCGQWTASPNVSRKLVLCGAALSDKEKELLVNFANLSGAAVTRFWNPDVTHVIASTNKDGACNRTLKFLMAILSGKWVVNTKWVEDCINHGHALAEEPYEISHDIHNFCDGPRRGRIRVVDKAPKLFVELGFYFSGYFRPSFKCQLEELVLSAGGILMKKDELMKTRNSNVKYISPKVLVVYNSEPLEADLTASSEKSVEKELKEAEALACNIGARVIPHSWILDSIAACKRAS
ncbi:BRCA1-associated RING domain protein 1-like isoform X2 [Iris pallida]|uniref:RING-type E3 ubiquitin transferase BRCA1 n=1 Tax=Iris pallida TaxID=29817 RepID=A0AAX6F0U8_IRIPA|nr:BRCA1-associated RING domain protein 1-like isoform X2 [Iris pallida]